MRNKFIVLISLQQLLFASVFCSPSFADDFPGKGNRGDWSGALPYYNRGNKYLEHGRIEEAVQDFEEAIYRYEYDPDFYVNYGVALRKRENYVGAEQAFKKAIELRNNDWQSWTNLASANLKQNKLKETIACFQKAMKLPNPPPPAERAAIMKDIADINKILSMQKPAVPPQPTATAQSKASVAAKNKKVAAVAAKKDPAKVTTTDPAKTDNTEVEPKSDLKHSGWDYVN